MPGVYVEFCDFATTHRGCGELRGAADPLERDGYRVRATCSCKARLERCVTPADAEEDLLRSTLLAFRDLAEPELRLASPRRYVGRTIARRA